MQTPFEVILVLVNSGFSETVMRLAKKARTAEPSSMPAEPELRKWRKNTESSSPRIKK